MKLLSFVTLSVLLSLSACSHHYKKSCSDKKMETTCKEANSQKPYSDKDKNCKDESCKKEAPKMDCADGSCEKKQR